MKCLNCGKEKIFKIENHTQGWFCLSCGDAIETSYFKDIEIDANEYSVYLLVNNNVEIEKNKIALKVSNFGYVKSNELLKSRGFIFSRLTREIYEKIDILRKAN